MIVAVLDTNVLVSAFPARGTVPATLLEAWRRGLYHLVVSEPILEELAETWRDPYGKPASPLPIGPRRYPCCTRRRLSPG